MTLNDISIMIFDGLVSFSDVNVLGLQQFLRLGKPPCPHTAYGVTQFIQVTVAYLAVRTV